MACKYINICTLLLNKYTSELTMSMQSIVAKQYKSIVNRAVNQLDKLSVPPEGWVKTVRTALSMTGSQLAERLGVTKSRVSRIEKDEIAGSVTLKTMQSTAEAMGCKFVYAIVPEKDVESVVYDKVYRKAIYDVLEAYKHMAFEEQGVSKEKLIEEVYRVINRIEQKDMSSVWDKENIYKNYYHNDPIYNYIYKYFESTNKKSSKKNK